MNKKIAFTGDQHYYHTNILTLCNRPFDNIIDHNDILINNHNTVAYDDSWEMWFLGDLALKCSARQVAEILAQLNGKLNILIGNHDKPLRQAWRNGLLDKMIKSGKVKIIGTEDRTEIVAKLLKIDHRTFILSHYAYRTWPNSFRNSIHLFGHSHNNLASYYRSFDMGVDANEYFPVLIEQVIARADAIDQNFSEK